MQFFFPPLAQWCMRKLKDISRCHLFSNACLCRYLGNPAQFCWDLCEGLKLCWTSLLQIDCIPHSPDFTALQALIINFGASIKKGQTWTSRWEEEQKYSGWGERGFPYPPTHTLSTTLHLSLLIISERNLTHCQCLWTLDIIRPAWRQIS